MKTAPLLCLFFLFLVAILNLSCSAHCDDEDYRKEKHEKKLVHNDSLAMEHYK